MKRLYIARHGETYWNLQGKTQGIKDSQLTDLGMKQAELLAERLQGEGIEVIYSSCLSRAISTAMIISKKLEVSLYCDKSLNEINYGDWEGLTLKEIRELYPNEFMRWRTVPHKLRVPGGETLEDAQKRIISFVNELQVSSKGKNVLFVSHSTINKLLLQYILGMELCNYYRLKQDNCCLNIIEFRDYGPVLLIYNETNYLKINTIGGIDGKNRRK